MTVYDLTMSFGTNWAKEVIINLWVHDNCGNEALKVIHKINTKSHSFETTDTYEYKNCKVIFFRALKKGVIDIVAVDESYD